MLRSLGAKRFFLPPALLNALWALLAMLAAAILVLAIPQWGYGSSDAGAADGSAGDATAAAGVHIVALPASVESLELRVTLAAPADAAARSWPFDITAADGAVLETVHAHLSGDAPLAIVPIDLPPDARAIGLRASTDVAATCETGALFGMAGALSVNGDSAVASFEIQPCPLR
jgi:hypothetical protein